MKSRLMIAILLLILASAELSGIHELAASTINTIHTSNADSYIQSSTPTSNYGTSTKLKVDPKTVSAKRTLLSFDLSSIPSGQVIVQAILSLYLTIPPSTSRVLEIHRVTANWTELGVTWNNQPSLLTTPTSTNASGTNATWISWIVTTDIALGYANPSQWFGFTIKDSQETIQSGGFLLDFTSREAAVSLRPQLTVIYALQIPEIPLWSAMILGMWGVAILWSRNSKRRSSRLLES